MDDSKRKKIEKLLARMEAEGNLTPTAVVEAAKNPRSPLHGEFEWDDAKAAHKHRIAQARVLIRTVATQVIVHGRRVAIPTYTHDPSRTQSQGYRAVATLKGETELAREALDAEVARVLAALERARTFAIALNLERKLDAILHELLALREDAA